MTPVGNHRGAREEASERLLVEAARKDPGRFIELYDQNFDQVYAYIAKRVRDRDLAEDLTADVFHKALANLLKFDWRGVPFAAWLIRIAANLITDHWNRSSREIVDDPPQTGTDSSLEERGERDQLFRLVGRLPDYQRRVIALRFAEGN